MKIDELNWKILDCLQKDARESFAKIGRKVGLTPPAVTERVKKMEDLGLIEGYRTCVSYSLAGHQLKAIVMLRAFMGKLKPFLSKVESFQEVINCYRITGNENIIMEVVLKDQSHLEKFIDELIVYGECRTHIVLSNIVANAPINASKNIL
ncbi:HTH-type transcriptional regulator LrpA [Flagellimonas maritima]|uniref:HTH-type transcriptional regulator LrpA n=1 Tax=Flagellimonas maritima TaxID=1383885 RepID=A0A2Z4LPZ3_9FLAO|nr:Lrp/AsnC family transcriptional regulator [Allomuricauda aurantiaca]AWX43478.1 HTH-type transcriptional regulator LrpA [Allomuricauda aurantiaca]